MATRKLALLDAAATVDLLRSPPGKHLEALERDRLGQHSIRIDDQWRVCLRWTPAGAEDVEIVDGHSSRRWGAEEADMAFKNGGASRDARDPVGSSHLRSVHS